jgi:cytochrome c-type biogenesis protein CcmH
MSSVRDWVALVALVVAALLATGAAGREALPKAADPVLEARMLRIASELRCLVCQNQTIADSDASLAVDLRRETRELLKQGKTDGEVIDYMTARYGDFVLYRPPLKATTALLWFGPAVLLLGGAAVLIGVLRRRSRLGADAFEADLDDLDDGDHVGGAGGAGARASRPASAR